MITFIKKDITTAIGTTIVHGCNAQGVMGSGVAKALRIKWPEIFPPYAELCNKYRNDLYVLLGTSTIYTDLLTSTNVINGITQVFYGKDGKKYANKEAIRSILIQSAMVALEQTSESGSMGIVHMPKIGCGLGGLSWKHDVYPVLSEVDDNISHKSERPVHFIVCDI